MASFALQEACRYPLFLNKLVDSTLSFSHRCLAVLTDKGVELLHFSHNVNSYIKQIDIVESFIKCPESSPITGIFPTHLFQKEMSNLNYTRCLIDATLWAHDNKHLHKVIAIQTFEWSPWVFIYNKSNLAVLTNAGTVQLFIRNRLVYDCILNITAVLVDNWRSETGSLYCDSDNINVLHNVCKKLYTCSICWGLKSKNGVYFVTAQIDGSIIFWNLRYHSDRNRVSADIKGVIEVGHEVIKMLWIMKSINESFLITSYVNGEICAHILKHQDDNITLSESKHLWTYQDKMKASYLVYITYENKIILLCDKYRHVLIQILDEHCNILAQSIKNIDDFKIIGILHKYNSFYIATRNCNIYKVDTVDILQDVNCEISELKFKEPYAEYHLNSISLSENGVFWGLNLSYHGIPYRKLPLKLDVVYLIFDDPENKEFDIMVNNPTEKLSNMSDCIELLRYKASKFKILPKTDYEALFLESSNNTYKLKIYLILLTLYNMHIAISSNKDKYTFPELSTQKIKDKILMNQAVNILNNILQLHKENGSLSYQQKEMFVCSKIFLIDFCEKYDEKINNYFKIDTLNLVDDADISYVCQCCDEELVNLKCKNKHVNQFCSVTLTPILSDDYLVCNGCNIVARKELIEENSTCTFCDLYLDDCWITDNSK